MLRVHQFGQPLRVRLIPDVPRPQRLELVEGRSRASLGHLRQSEVDRVGEDNRQEQRPVFGGCLRAQVGEMASEVRPAVDFEQQVGDLEMRHDAVDRFLESFRRLRHALRERLDLEQFIGEVGIGECARCG